MKRESIKWRIFQYNIIVIIVLITLTTIIFNMAIKLYIESDTKKQLDTIASRAEDTALHIGPDFFPPHPEGVNPPDFPPNMPRGVNPQEANNDIFRFYFMLDRSLSDPLSYLNADYILLDSKKEIISFPDEGYLRPPSDDILNRVTNEIGKLKDPRNQKYINFMLNGTEYIAIIKPVSSKNTFGLGWIIIYSSLQKVNQLQWGINTILFMILVISALIIAIISSLAAKKITAPFSTLNKYISKIAERNFGTKIQMPVYEELQEFVNNINIMSEKLESHDKAQKTFLQNASHEFRTPLMSIQSYAEGIKYDVVDGDSAAQIIIDETKRMTHLVEDLLYLSRLDAIEESYRFNPLSFNEFINCCIDRMNGIATKNNIKIEVESLNDEVFINADEEKLSRAFTNVISNCIRYAKTSVRISAKIIENDKLEVSIIDDGPGIDIKDLPNIFERFYKGVKGKFGLGLAISKNVIEKHSGRISAENLEIGAIFKIILPNIYKQ